MHSTHRCRPCLHAPLNHPVRVASTEETPGYVALQRTPARRLGGWRSLGENP